MIFIDNSKRYGTPNNAGQNQFQHRRTSSQSIPPLEGLPTGPELTNIRNAVGGPNVDLDVFPPIRSQARDPSIFLPYISEDVGLDDFDEEYLRSLGLTDDHGGLTPGGSAKGLSAWQRLSMFTSADIGADAYSDSESIVSVGELGPEQRLDEGSADENINNWEVRVINLGRITLANNFRFTAHEP